MSVDIFDTLLFRLCEYPTDIFYYTACKAQKQGILHPSITCNDFKLMRVQAEQNARNNKLNTASHSEVTIDEIYSHLPNFIGNRNKILNIELDTESQHCYLNPEVYNMVQKFHSQGSIIVLTSDMYLNSYQLSNILKANDFDLNIIKNIFVSCEHRCSKSTGNLFKILLKNFPKLYSKNVLHIGDKIDSDIDSPKSFGFQTFHYNVIPETSKEMFDFEKINELSLGNFYSLRKLSIHLSSHSNKVESQIGAGILSPVFTLFCDWILDTCLNENKFNIFPLMREAEVFYPMLVNAAKKRNLKLNINPLFVSRQSTWLASIKEWNENECLKLMQRTGIRVNDIFKFLQIKKPNFIDKANGLTDIKDLSPSTFAQLKDSLLSKLSYTTVNKNIKKQRRLFLKYLKQMTASKSGFVTVDLGFNGSIAENIESIIEISENALNITHFMVLGTDLLISKKMRGLDLRCFLSSPDNNQDYAKTIHRSMYPLEQAIIGRTGTTTGYKNDGEYVKPIIQKNINRNYDFKVKENIHCSALQFQNLWYSLKSEKRTLLKQNLNHNLGIRNLVGIIHRLINTPTIEEAKLLGDLYHDHNYGSEATMKICSEMDSIHLIDSLSENKFLKTCRIYGVHWPQGVITKHNRYFLLKKMLNNSSSDSYLQTMNNLIELVKSEKFSNIIIYGAGEVGKAAKKAADMNNINVECFIDRNESLWGSQIENIPVLSISQALEKFVDTALVIGSFGFLKQIKSIITKELREKKLNNRFFSVENI